jgi:hypothetical protein
VSKIIDARYNEKEMIHEFLVAWRGFPAGNGQLGCLLSYGCGCSRDGGEVHGEVHGVARRHRHRAKDVISLRVLMEECFTLLKMRSQSISNADVFFVFSCGKVGYD